MMVEDGNDASAAGGGRLRLAMVCAIGGVVLLVGGLGWTAALLTQDPNWSQLSARGDFLGGHVGAIGSIVGALLFLAALLYQGEDLRRQTEEMRKTNAEQRKQAEALENSRHLTLFFELVRTRRELFQAQIDATPPMRAAMIRQSRACREALGIALRNTGIDGELGEILERVAGIPDSEDEVDATGQHKRPQ